MLDSTEPHFIRCIKPNSEKKSWVIEPQLVLDQLRCNGVLEGIRISRLGYPLRVPYNDFIKRFRPLAPAKDVLPPQPEKAAEAILGTTKLKRMDDYQFGRSKVFLRANVNAFLEKLRNEKVAVCAIRVQRAYRRHLFRRNYKKWRNETRAAALIQKNVRLWLQVKGRLWNQIFTAMKPMLKTTKLDEELHEAKTQLAQNKETLAKTEAERDELAKKQKDAQRRIEELDQHIQVQSKRSKDLTEELQDVRQKAALASSVAATTQQQLNDKVDDLSNMLATEQESKVKLQKEVLSLTAKSQDLEEDLASAKDGIALLEKTKSSLSAQVKELQDRVAKLEDEVAALKKAKAALEQELAAAKATIEAEQRAKGEAQRQLQQSQSDLTQTREDLEANKQAKARLERAVKSNEARISDLEASLESGDKDKSELAKQANRQVDELKAQIEQEVAVRQKTQQEKEAREVEIAQVKAGLAKEKGDREKVERDRAEQKRQIEELTAALEAEKAARAAAEKARAKADATVKEVTDNLEAEQGAKQRLEKTKKQQDQDIAELTAARDTANAKVGELDQHVKDLEGAIESLNIQIESEQRVKAQLTKGRDLMEAKVSELQEQLEERSGKEATNIKSLIREQQMLKEQIETEIESKQRAEEVARDANAMVIKLTQQLQGMVDKAKFEALDREAKSRDEAHTAERDELKAAKDKAETALRKAKDVAATAEAATADRDSRIAKLDSDLKAAREQADRTAAELTAVTAQAAALNEKSRKVESELATMQGQMEEEALKASQRISKQKKEYEALTADLNEQIETLEASVQKAEARARRAAADAQEASSSAEAKVASVNSAKAALEKQLFDLKAALEAGGEKKVEDVRRAL
jgi:chromosome segregation ATPase